MHEFLQNLILLQCFLLSHIIIHLHFACFNSTGSLVYFKINILYRNRPRLMVSPQRLVAGWSSTEGSYAPKFLLLIPVGCFDTRLRNTCLCEDDQRTQRCKSRNSRLGNLSTSGLEKNYEHK